MPDAASPASSALVSCMRDEGLFVLEWVAYHQVIGFDRIVICTNDCTDGSDLLLDRLQALGHVVHLRNRVPQGAAPQDSGMRLAFGYLSGTDVEWLAHLDSDEFLDIGLGRGRVQDLLRVCAEGGVIALSWLAFGDNGHRAWPGAVLPHFTACEPHPVPERVKFKSMFRHRLFAHADDHMPKGPLTAAPRVVSAAGEPLSNAELFAGKRAKYRPFAQSIRPDAACVNHYAVKSRDVFLMKNERGDGQGKTSDKYRIGSRWHRTANRNEAQSRRILRHWPAVQAAMDLLRRDPQVARAEQDCRNWFEHQRRRLTPADLPPLAPPPLRQERAQ